MKAAKKELNFKRDVIVELNDKQINHVKGGSWTVVESMVRAATFGTWIDHGNI